MDLGREFFKKTDRKGWLQCKVLHFFKKISKYQRFSLGNLPQKTEGIVSAARSAKKKTWQLDETRRFQRADFLWILVGKNRQVKHAAWMGEKQWLQDTFKVDNRGFFLLISEEWVCNAVMCF